jgi:FtsP/CotA-like multicopper oxidase with cupredoxin domain
LAAALIVFFMPASAAGRAPAAQTGGAPAGSGLSGGAPSDFQKAHDASEGLKLVAAPGETVGRGPTCRKDAPVRDYQISAIDVDITLDRYLDHDPQGMMFVLDSGIEKVRAEEKRNADARKGAGDPAVSAGLQGDAIQPLTLRVKPGDCLRVGLTNRLSKPGPVSFHLHDSSLVIAGTRTPAIATEKKAYAKPGKTVSYEWMVPAGEPDGTHYFHSHGDARFQTGHGLFGAVVVEPRGSRALDPRNPAGAASGWDAVVARPGGKTLREYVLYYHEIGNESYQILDGSGHYVPLVDPVLSDYRPGTRALNYRSEPFMDRIKLGQAANGRIDESQAYSSYSFGDPATPVLRAYLGDPVLFRVVHAGPEVFHVHHVHGGGIRWDRQVPAADQRPVKTLDKHPPLLPRATERLDSQAIGPSETFDESPECGAGGCQQSAGDFLFHCHVAQHYFAGMWGIWRVYNTLQDGKSSTDSLPPLPALDSRKGSVAAAVTSDALKGTAVDWYGLGRKIDDPAAWAAQLLPPRGKPGDYDASVFDWAVAGGRVAGEPDDTAAWPGYRSASPGKRPPILFDPKTGKLAYPFLHPHLAHRPPFPPGHNPSPFLDPLTDADGLAPPGANGPGSLCPSGTKLKPLAINAISTPVTLNKRTGLVDPDGEIYVLRDQESAVVADDSLKRPLAIRTDAGQDCVDVLFRSELRDTPQNHGFAKADLHIHFLQFDIQASDGVVTGFNYEQSVRPYAAAGQKLAAPAPAGSDHIRVGAGAGFQAEGGLKAGAGFQVGAMVGIGLDRDHGFEVAKVAGVSGSVVTLDRKIGFSHGAGEVVSTEFMRYRWYPDIQSGTAYFHDHVNAISSWAHGLFGALVVEPPSATFHDPHTGAEVESGPLADVHAAGPVSADVTGSFRELVAFIQDDVPINSVGRSAGSALNLRAEPVDGRGDPQTVFESRARGDPETAVLEAYLGDPVLFRTLVAGTNDVHTWHIDGHWFRAEPFDSRSTPIDTVHVGISERYDLFVPAAGGPQRMPGDYLFYNGRTFKLREGSWGILRVHGAKTPALQPLPGHEAVPSAAASVCSAGAPLRAFNVVATDAQLPMLEGKTGHVFALAGASPKTPEPLVLHVQVGDCVELHLVNRTSAPVSVHADMLAWDPKDSSGVAVGDGAPQAAPPGGARAYRFYASPQVGETAALLRDLAGPIAGPASGLFGAIVVVAKGARVTDPASGADAFASSSWAVDVKPRGGPGYRDFTLFMQDADAGIGTHRMPYAAQVEGVSAINYRSAPFSDRARNSGADLFGGPLPSTPLLRADAGDPMRIHVLVPSSEQAQVFSVEGHEWPSEPWLAGSTRIDSMQVGALESSTAFIPSAGGPLALPGDYLYGDHREPYREAGMWGILRVGCRLEGLERIGPQAGSCTSPVRRYAPWVVAAVVALAAAAILRSYFQRRYSVKGSLWRSIPATRRGGPASSS